MLVHNLLTGDNYWINEEANDDSITLKLNRTEKEEEGGGIRRRQDICAYSKASGFGHKISGNAVYERIH